MSLLGVYIQSIASNGQRTYIMYSGILTLSKEPINWVQLTINAKNLVVLFILEEMRK